MPDDPKSWCEVTIHLKPLTLVMEKSRMRAFHKVLTEQSVGDDATILTLNGRADPARRLPAVVTVDLDEIAGLRVVALPPPPPPVRRRREHVTLVNDPDGLIGAAAPEPPAKETP